MPPDLVETVLFLNYRSPSGNELIELSELVAYVQDRVPKLAAQTGGTGRSFTAVSAHVDVSQTPR